MITDPSERLAVVAARVAEDKGAQDITVFAVGEILGVCEYFVLASARNDRLVKAVVEQVEAEVARVTDRRPTAVEGLAERRWVLLDYGDVIVHVFHEEDRQFYRLERLYADAPVTDWAHAELTQPAS